MTEYDVLSFVIVERTQLPKPMSLKTDLYRVLIPNDHIAIEIPSGWRALAGNSDKLKVDTFAEFHGKLLHGNKTHVDKARELRTRTRIFPA